ncbi:MAG: molybdenum cofactor biosynthesis protein MoaE, partial [Planctomycetes bacterium]|nr:molybdenum cofactor biosynthesis protein MoaE [Planctomycetota bacterium]
MIQIIEEVIDYSELTETVRSTRAGGVVLFLGTTREITGEQVTMSLDYEAYPEMAQKELSKLESAACQQWSLLEVSIIHRLGHLDPGDISVAVAVSSVHRKDAFESAQ